MGVFRLVAWVALGLLPWPGLAAVQSDINPGDAGIFFDALGTTTGRWGVIAFVPFDVYVVSHSASDGMQAYEFSLIPPTGMLVATGRVLPPGANDVGVGPDNWIVSTGEICQGAVGPFVMVRYRDALFLSTPANNTPICIGGATPSGVPGEVAGYQACGESGETRPFGRVLNGCALLNPYRETPNEATHWGELKARFDR